MDNDYCKEGLFIYEIYKEYQVYRYNLYIGDKSEEEIYRLVVDIALFRRMSRVYQKE